MTRDEIIKNYFALHGELPTAEEVNKLLKAHNQSEQPDETSTQQTDVSAKTEIIVPSGTKYSEQELENCANLYVSQFNRVPDAEELIAYAGKVSSINDDTTKVQNIQQTPKLTDTWKTNVGLSVLGAFTAYFTCGIALIYGIIHATVIYPSLFTDNPKVKSNGAISFLNEFGGGPIFGSIWNSNLTNKKKGSSNIVFTVFAILAVVSLVLSISFGRLGGGDTSQNGLISSWKSEISSLCAKDWAKDGYKSEEQCKTTVLQMSEGCYVQLIPGGNFDHQPAFDKCIENLTKDE